MTLSSEDRLLPVQATDGPVIFPQAMTPPASTGDRMILVQTTNGPRAVLVTRVDSTGQRGLPAALTDGPCLVQFGGVGYYVYVFGVNYYGELGLGHTTNTQTPTQLTHVRNLAGNLEEIDPAKIGGISHGVYGLMLLYDGRIFRSGYYQAAPTRFCEFETRDGVTGNIHVSGFSQVFHRATDLAYDNSGVHAWRLPQDRNYMYTVDFRGEHVDLTQSEIEYVVSRTYIYVSGGNVYCDGQAGPSSDAYANGWLGVGLIAMQYLSGGRWYSHEYKIAGALPNLTGIVAVARGRMLGMALDSGGNIWVWSFNKTSGFFPPLDGTNQTGDEWQYCQVPILARGISNVTKIAGTPENAYAVTSDGELYRLGNGVWVKEKTIHNVTEIWTSTRQGGYIAVRCGEGNIRRKNYDTDSGSGFESNWTIIDGIPDASTVALNNWFKSCAAVLLNSPPPASLPSVVYHWTATWNGSAWAVEAAGTSYGEDEHDWTDRGGYWDKITASGSPAPSAPSAASDDYYYHWKAVYSFPTLEWTVSLLGSDTFGPAMSWSAPARSICVCTTTSSSPPADPTTPTLYYHWGVSYDCSSASWNTPTLMEKSFIKDKAWYEYGSWTSIYENEIYSPNKTYTIAPPSYSHAMTTNSATTPSAPITTPTCYYYWSAFYDCWGAEWYVMLDYADSVGDASDWSCTADPYGDYCIRVTTSDTEPPAPAYTPTCA